MTWLNVVREALLVAYYSLQWIFFTAAYLAVRILQFVILPVSALWKALLFLLAPVTYTVSFFFSPLFIIINNIPRLAPLYIYFSSAVFIGLLCGLIVALTTSITFSLLNLYGDENPPPAIKQDDPFNTPSRKTSTPGSTTSEQSKELDALLAGISSNPESDHLIAALQGSGGGWRDPANTKRKRRSASGGGGLVSLGRFGTILEEDDDSL